jgi:hypothetical protein
VANGIDVASGGAGNLPPLPQMAGPGAVVAGGSVLSGSELAPVVSAAIDRLAVAGHLSASQVAQLQSVRFAVGDLGDGEVGEHVGGLVRLDADAGGRGWFVDATPNDDAEFTPTSLTQGAGRGAAGRGVDLLTVVMHELSHELGAIDLNPAVVPDSLMTESLGAGVRRLPNGGTWALSVDVPSVAVSPPVVNRVSGYLQPEDKAAVPVAVAPEAVSVVSSAGWTWADAPAVGGWSMDSGAVRADVPVLRPDWFGDDLGGIHVG